MHIVVWRRKLFTQNTPEIVLKCIQQMQYVCEVMFYVFYFYVLRRVALRAVFSFIFSVFASLLLNLSMQIKFHKTKNASSVFSFWFI